jgi:hypothetical protein
MARTDLARPRRTFALAAAAAAASVAMPAAAQGFTVPAKADFTVDHAVKAAQAAQAPKCTDG